MYGVLVLTVLIVLHTVMKCLYVYIYCLILSFHCIHVPLRMKMHYVTCARISPGITALITVLGVN